MNKVLTPKQNKTRRALLIVAIVLTSALLCSIIGVGAKYIFSFNSLANQVRANDFFFTVDLLGDTNEYEELSTDVHLFGNDQKVLSFNIQNYFDDLRVNEKDIKYSITYTCDNDNYLGYELTDSNSQEVSSGFATTLEKGSQLAHTYTLTMPAGYETLLKSPVITVTVKSTEPYTKEMKINFILHGQTPPVTYRVEDKAGDTYATLIVMASEQISAGKLRIDWSDVNNGANNLQIDTTSKFVLNDLTLSTNNPGSSYLTTAVTTRQVLEDESILIYFFKADPTKNYSTNGDVEAVKTGDIFEIEITENIN